MVICKEESTSRRVKSVCPVTQSARSGRSSRSPRATALNTAISKATQSQTRDAILLYFSNFSIPLESCIFRVCSINLYIGVCKHVKLGYWPAVLTTATRGETTPRWNQGKQSCSLRSFPRHPKQQPAIKSRLSGQLTTETPSHKV